MADRSELEVVADALEAEFQRIQRRRQIAIWRDAAQAAITALDAHRIAEAEGVVERLAAHRVTLKSGGYDGADLMQAWCCMIDAATLILAQKAEIERHQTLVREMTDEGAWADGYRAGELKWAQACEAMTAEIERIEALARPDGFRWGLGAKLGKKRGSSWRGTVCGFYSTPHTPEGYCIASEFEPGSVQVWPAAALEELMPSDWPAARRVEHLREALAGMVALYDSDEGCRTLPQVVAAREALHDLEAAHSDPEAGEVDRRLTALDAQRAIGEIGDD